MPPHCISPSFSPQTVKKIILHTNLPGHYNFTRYSKCNFVLLLDTETAQAGDQFFEARFVQWLRSSLTQCPDLGAVYPLLAKPSSFTLPF